MQLIDIVRRAPAPEPWAEGEKIPWDDPGFSERMLREHLNQDHDAASRRFEIIDAHVKWIHDAILHGRPSRILDLGCGPGLYTSRLAERGHTCIGIDFGPASIAYARRQAEEDGLDCRYQLADIRTADWGHGYGLVMLIFGEFNVFCSEDARLILDKSRQALAPGGHLLIEAHTYRFVREQADQPAIWRSFEHGLFSARPHLRLEESFWNEKLKVATQRYYIIDAETGAVTRHAASIQAYTVEGYRSLFAERGFKLQETFDSPGDVGEQQGFLVVLASKI